MTSPSPHEGEGGARSAQRNGRVRGYEERTLKRAKQLRRDMTDAERKLWSILRSRQLDGAKFRRQQPIGPFIADLVCQDAKLIVEADGGQHSEDEADKRRTAYLSSKGYRILRFWNNDILTNLDAVADAIRAALETPHPPTASQRVPPSPSRGEGLGAQNG
jgi:very-short-patch-repair endonuclease